MRKVAYTSEPKPKATFLVKDAFLREAIREVMAIVREETFHNELFLNVVSRSESSHVPNEVCHWNVSVDYRMVLYGVRYKITKVGNATGYSAAGQINVKVSFSMCHSSNLCHIRLLSLVTLIHLTLGFHQIICQVVTSVFSSPDFGTLLTSYTFWK